MAMAATMRGTRVEIPWGRADSLALDFPSDWPIPEVVLPDLAGATSDYPSALAHALDSPNHSEPLESLACAGTRVAIIVDDPSRWTPVREALPLVLDRLIASGVRPADVTVCVGVGRHRAVDAQAMVNRVGESVATKYRCLSPPLDDVAEYDHLGVTPEGVPVRVFRPVAQADLRILIGSVLPHLQAGFGGGYKLIFPGTSHRSTLGALHRMGLAHGRASRLLGGEAAHNPMRIAIASAAALLPGRCFSVSHLLGAPGQILHVAAGDPIYVQDLLAAEAARRFQSPHSAPANVIFVGNHPWPGDPMQSFKVLLQHRASCRPGGVLAGLFWTDPNEVDRSMPKRWLRTIAASGRLGECAIRTTLPAAEHALATLRRPGSFLLSWARELVVDRQVFVYAPPLVREVGHRLGPVRLFDDLPRLFSSIVSSLGGRVPERVRVFPEGGLTYQPEPETREPGTSPEATTRAGSAGRAERTASAQMGPGGLR